MPCVLRRGQDDNDEPLEPFLATPFADDEVDEAPATGVQSVEPGAEFGHLATSHAPVSQVRACHACPPLWLRSQRL